MQQEHEQMTEQGNVVPFGKYKGRLVEELLVDDPNYLEWLAGQDWFRAKYVTLHQVIINRGGEPEETPDHNALQVLFLDDDECLKFLRTVEPDCDAKIAAALNNERNHNLKLIAEKIEYDEQGLRNLNEALQRRPDEAEWWQKQQRETIERTAEELSVIRIAQKQFRPPIEMEFHINRKFEEGGVDVCLSIDARSPAHEIAKELSGLVFRSGPYDRYLHEVSVRVGTFRIEIKPSVGDDYPAVLRQMRASRSDVLFLERYTGTGATREQRFMRALAEQR
jgi:uncharacterized protein (DUF3820 family)